jgi:hypoxanthine phosphoribosyltransferase
MKKLLTDDELHAGVRRVAAQINEHYDGRPLTIIGILTGSVILLADLIRLLEMPLRVGVLQARSYHGATTQRGELTIYDDLMPDITDRDVLLVDDIFDTGHTLLQVIQRMQALGPRSIKSLVLLRKEGRQEVELEPDFVGFGIPDKFVVGYGLDYEDEYRNLPYLAALEEDDLR